ncbi:MAG: polysaccharide deacetylase family protein [Clostridia bacterium]|nr:polysaccharide deacetylase family protein [Clostridia bacterium]
MKKVRFGVLKIRKHIVNAAIAIMLGVVAGFAFVASGAVASTSTINGVYYNGDKTSKNVSLMINVYWGTEYLDDMLSTLKEHDVQTTFFVGGVWAVKNEDYLIKIRDEGHEIANHGYHHKDHDKISEKENINQIKNTHTIVKQLTGVEMNLFAPPSGAYNSTTVEAANSLGYRTIMWTRDTIDWRDHDSELIYSRAIKNACGGDLILMHPTQETAKALPKIIQYFQQNGFNLTTVSENIGKNAV